MSFLLAAALALMVVILARWIFDPTTKWQAIFAICGMIVGVVGCALAAPILVESHHVTLAGEWGTIRVLEAATLAGGLLGVIVAKVIRV